MTGAHRRDGISWAVKSSFYFLLSILFFVPLIFSTRTYDNFALNKSIFFHVGTAFLAGCVLVLSPSRGAARRVRLVNFLFLPLCVFFIFSTVSFFISPDIRRSFLGEYQRFDGYYHFANLLLFYLCALYVLSPDNLSYCVAGILVSGFCVSMYAVLQHFGIDIFSWGSLDRRSISTLGHANTLAGYLSMVFPMAFSEYVFPFVSPKSGVYRGFALIVCILLFFALLVTFSRAGYVAWMGGLILLCVLLLSSPHLHKSEFMKRSFALIVCFGACIVFVNVEAKRDVLPVTLKERIFSATDLQESTVRERILIWESAFRIVQSFPVWGCGFESLKSVFPQFKSKALSRMGSHYVADKAHNEYVHIAATRGLTGFFSYLWILSAVILCGRMLIRKTRAGDIRMFKISAMFFSALCAYCINVFFGFSTIATQVLFFFSLAVISALSAITQTEGKQDGEENGAVQESPPKRLFPAIVFFAFIAVSLAWNVTAWKADAYYNASRKTLPGQTRLAISLVEKSMMYNPLEPEYKMEVARQYAGLYAREGRRNYFKKAAEAYQSLLRQNERDVDALYAYAVLVAYRGRTSRQPHLLKEAATIFRRAHAFSPNYPLYLTALAETYFDLSSYENEGVNLEKALRAAQESFDVSPYSPDTQFLLVKLYYKKKKYTEAFNMLRFILRRRPRDTVSLIWMGNIHQETGQFREAVRAYKMALTTNPAFPAGVYVEMAKAYLNLGDKAGARQRLEQALWLHPDYEQAAELLARIKKVK